MAKIFRFLTVYRFFPRNSVTVGFVEPGWCLDRKGKSSREIDARRTLGSRLFYCSNQPYFATQPKLKYP